MAYEKHLAIFLEGKDTWNKWMRYDNFNRLAANLDNPILANAQKLNDRLQGLKRIQSQWIPKDFEVKK